MKAGGDLGWDSGDTEALVAVTIIQMDEKLMGTASSPPKFPPWKPKWVLDVKPTDRQKKFKQGPAHALGVAFTMNAGIRASSLDAEGPTRKLGRRKWWAPRWPTPVSPPAPDIARSDVSLAMPSGSWYQPWYQPERNSGHLRAVEGA